MNENVTDIYYSYLQEKWEKHNKQERMLHMTTVFGKHETLAIINEKARLRDMTYGKYVQAREQGLYSEDRDMKIKMAHKPMKAFTRSHKGH